MENKEETSHDDAHHLGVGNNSLDHLIGDPKCGLLVVGNETVGHPALPIVICRSCFQPFLSY